MNAVGRSRTRRWVWLGLILATLMGGLGVTYKYLAQTGWPWLGQFRQDPSAVHHASDQIDPKATESDAEEDTDLSELVIIALIEDALKSGDASLLDPLKPRGITKLEGAGGKGFSRQVKSMGLWFPVFDLSKARRLDGSQIEDFILDADVDPDTVSLTRIPLSIVAAQPPPVSVGSILDYTFGAIGGQPPYTWSQDGSQWTLDADTGRLAGPSGEAGTTPVTIRVTDSDGATASARVDVFVRPLEPLVIKTGSLGLVAVGESLRVVLEGSGGLPPYQWSMITETSLLCDSQTGVVSGIISEPGDYIAEVTLTDSQAQQVKANMSVTVSEGIEIITSSPLPSAEPVVPYTQVLEAKGGRPPYVWSAGRGFPADLKLDSSGVIRGLPGKSEVLYEFDLKVKDQDGLSHQRKFQLAVMQALLAVPSQRSAGLAWRPAAIARRLGSAVVSAVLTREGPDGTKDVASAGRSNLVDRGLMEGSEYHYQLNVRLADGREMKAGRSSVTILPFTRERSLNGRSGDPYADRVAAFSPLTPGGFGSANLPGNVLGPPDGVSTYEPAWRPEQLASLHASSLGGGSITLEFTNNIMAAGDGLDFTIFENVMFVGRNPNRRFMEPATVEVALWEDDWTPFPSRVIPSGDAAEDVWRPGYYAQGFAGINATTGEDPADPTRSGGDSFDLAVIGRSDLSWFRFIRLRSTGENVRRDHYGTIIRHNTGMNATSGSGSSGFDLDAVSAVHF
jgi:hypothetical protein